MSVPLLATAVAWCGAAMGLWLTGLRHRVGPALAFSAGVLLGVTAFGLLPELAGANGWPASLLLFAAGYGLLLAINRFVYPVCPTCAHDHEHRGCSSELHGFGVPLVSAAAIHSFLDGWSIVSVQRAAPLGLRIAVPLAITLHKLPEGIALGGVLRAAVASRGKALLWSGLAEGATLAGAALGIALAPRLGFAWTSYPLGITAGWLFYLGYHAVEEEWKRRGAVPALTATLAGVAGAAVVQRGAEALLR
ncbi:MAG: ZIP family metal transporter [Bryobacteraceae bacterium]